MERELWMLLYQLARDCDPQPWWAVTTFDDFEIAAVYLWAVVHDRATSWACDANNWPKGLWQGKLPSQSIMSRRLGTTEVCALLYAIESRLVELQNDGLVLEVDGKPLPLGSHSKDPDAEWGHVRRGWAKGYKLHALFGSGCMPLRWEVATLNIAEPNVAVRLISSLERGGGYILGDSSYDSNPLHDASLTVGYQLVAQRKRPKAGLGHRRHSPGRMRSIELLQGSFGRSLYALREDVERKFGWLTNHGAGLAPLPNWVRRLHRVQLWILAKLIIHGVYVYLYPNPPPLAVA